MDISGIGIFAAFLAGAISFLSPCVLPLVPPYLCYMAGVSADELRAGRQMGTTSYGRLIATSVTFVLGFSTVFIMLGAGASTIGQLLRQNLDWLGMVAGVAIIVMGLNFLGVFRLSFLSREARISAPDKPRSILGAYLMGLAFAFGWTPCVGPVLAAILFTAAGAETSDQGALLLLAYALGMTLPFVVAAAFIGPFLSWAKGFRKYLPVVEKVMGGFLIIFGLLIAFDAMRFISEFMLSIAPDIGTLQ